MNLEEAKKIVRRSFKPGAQNEVEYRRYTRGPSRHLTFYPHGFVKPHNVYGESYKGYTKTPHIYGRFTPIELTAIALWVTYYNGPMAAPKKRKK